MKILSVDSSSFATSVAVVQCAVEQNTVLAYSLINRKLTHSQTLMLALQNMLTTADIPLSDIDNIAVSIGPGSFTGLRIGIAAVKGIAQAMDKPCVAVSTLEAIAAFALRCRKDSAIICPVMDARGEQVYAALFKNGERQMQDSAMTMLELADCLKQFDEPILLTGDGAKAFFEKYSTTVNNIALAPADFQMCSAVGIADVAAEMLCNSGNATVTAAELSPVYLRLPQAQRELEEKQKLLTAIN